MNVVNLFANSFFLFF